MNYSREQIELFHFQTVILVAPLGYKPVPNSHLFVKDHTYYDFSAANLDMIDTHAHLFIVNVEGIS